MLSNSSATQIQSNTNKAYAALEYARLSNTDQIPLPGVVNTRRPKMTSKQIAGRYLASVKDNPDIDINKMKLRGDAPTDSGIITGKRNVAQSREFATKFSAAFIKEWQEIKCDQIRTFDFRDNGFKRACNLLSVHEEENFIGNHTLSIAITALAASVSDHDYTIGITHGDKPLFLESYIADPILIGTENFSKKKLFPN